MKILPMLIKEICLADSKLNLISCKIFFEQVLFSVILNLSPSRFPCSYSVNNTESSCHSNNSLLNLYAVKSSGIILRTTPLVSLK